jgi:DNA-binding XRE family transcriptional regulator
MADLSKLDPSKVNVKSTYRKLTPEERAHYQRLAELADQDKEWASAEADRIFEKAMKTGLHRRAAIANLVHLRKQQELSFEEMNARSGIDRDSAAELEKKDADPTLKTLEAYAEALGKKLLIVLADAGDDDDE